MTTKAKKDYSKGKIYKIEPICDHEEGEVYIGSTTKDYLSQRMVFHREGFNYWKTGKGKLITCFKLFDKYGISNCDIILLESVPAKNYNELVAREAHYIRTLKCVNKYIPLRTGSEYYEDNKDSILLKKKEYKEKNKDMIKLTDKVYRILNKDKIKEYESKKFNCDCGSECAFKRKQRHFRTIKHQEYLKTLNPII